MKLEIEVNDAALRAKWSAAQQQLPGVLSKTMGEAVLYVHSQVPGYPAPPPTSTYRRTGLTGRGITTAVRPLGADVVGVLGTAVVYAPWVIDQDRQAAVHQGRWYHLQGVVQKSLDKVMQMFGDAVEKLLD